MKEGVLALTLILSIPNILGQLSHGLPAMPPYFFLCNYHGNVQELGRGSGEVKLSVTVDGNPDSYVPGNFYKGQYKLFPKYIKSASNDFENI